MEEPKKKLVLWEFFKNQLKSFDNTKAGNSARKSTAFVIICMVVYLHIKIVDLTVVKEVMWTDYVAIFVLFGMTTIERLLSFIIQIIRFFKK